MASQSIMVAMGEEDWVLRCPSSAREKGEISLLTGWINNNDNSDSSFSSRFVPQLPRESHGDLARCAAPFYRWGN